ncbi:MAG: hypothetical protein R3Y63_12280 [Eubacteriales bacterium]
MADNNNSNQDPQKLDTNTLPNGEGTDLLNLLSGGGAVADSILSELTSLSAIDFNSMLSGTTSLTFDGAGGEEVLTEKNDGVYDKAKWHIDGDEDENEVYERFKAAFEFLDANNMLNEEGKKVLNSVIDDTVIISEELLTQTGVDFLDKYYDKALGDNPFDMKTSLGKCLTKFKIRNKNNP